MLALALSAPGAEHTPPAPPLNVIVYTGVPAPAQRSWLEPVVARLGEFTGRPVKLTVSTSAFGHWRLTRRPEQAHVVVDAPHFTDYRVKRHGFEVVARLARELGFTIVTSGRSEIIDPEDLHGQAVATLAPPSLASARMSQLYPDPIRSPLLIEVASYVEGVTALTRGEVVAAVIPTDSVAQYPELAVVVVCEDDPGFAASLSPRLSKDDRRAITRALLDPAPPTDQAHERFTPANAALYDGYAELLRGIWGFDADPPREAWRWRKLGRSHALMHGH